MPSLKVIRRRIASVKNTQQITKAMKMVSAAKLRRAQEAVVAARPYAEKLDELLANLGPAGEHPLLRRAGEVRRAELVLVSSDRGLCGAYNATLLRSAQAWLRENRDVETALTIVGRKGVEFFRRRDVTIAEKYVQIAGASIGLAREIAAPLRERFVAGEVDRVDVLFARFRSALSQVPTVTTVMPVSSAPPAGDDEGQESPEEGGREPVEYLMEPGPSELLSRLLPQVIEARIHQALLEAQASEYGARMTAMDSATRNAGEMIFKLTLAMNRARQAAITTELMEIVSGAEALRE